MSNPACIPVVQDKEWMSTAAWLQRHEEHLALRDAGGYDLVLLGDSITQGWKGTGLDIFERDFAGLSVANFGIAGDACEHLLWRIEHGEIDGLEPKVITLLIGTNNLGNEGHSGEQTAAGVAAVLAAVRSRCPQARIILHAVLPRDEQPGTPFRQAVAVINETIRSLADGEQVIWFDIGHRFLADDDVIPAILMPDFLHLTPLGYSIWSEELLPVLQAILAPATPCEPG